MCACAQEPPVDLLAAADEAARAFDYDGAIKQLQPLLTDPQREAVVKQRIALYSEYLTKPELVALAKDNPDRLVGWGKTRGGRELTGLIQLLELGVRPDCRLGNRALDEGALALQVVKAPVPSATAPVPAAPVEGTATPAAGPSAEEDRPAAPPEAPAAVPAEVRTLKAREIGRVTVTWAAPVPQGWPVYWSIQKLQVMLHTGEVVEGTPTWALPLSGLSVRAADADEDTVISVFPAFGKTINPEDLAAELVIIGAPVALPTGPAPPE